jgi:hypothetical protein
MKLPFFGSRKMAVELEINRKLRIPRHENYHSERMKIIVPMRSRLTIPG